MGANEIAELSVFNRLNTIDVNNHTEKKGNLTYLSWAWAWAETKKAYPDTTYKVYENNDGWNYFTDGRTCWVKVSVTIKGLEHIEYLPIMDFKNKSIPLGNVTSFEVNKSIQRALTKAIARHGLGLYIYAGEDLPEQSDGQTSQDMQVAYKTQSKQTDDEKAKYWNEFVAICKSVDVEAKEFLIDFAEVDMSDKKRVFNTVAKYLKDKETMFDQLNNYKIFKLQKQGA